MAIKNGEVNWTDVSGGEKKSGGGKDTFMRLMPGSNIVRVVTLPFQYNQHRYSPDGGKKYGYRVNCSMANGSCPLCEKGDKPKRRWYLGVIDRKTNMYKILDIGYGVFKGISSYVKDESWGDTNRYDVDLLTDPNNGPMAYYTVVCKPPKPLSAGDLQIKAENDVEDLARRAQAPTPEKVAEKLRAIQRSEE